jgi:hypothetical protein
MTMQAPLVYEIIGYIASLLVALSLTMRSILRLRLINLAGAVFFTIYGLLIRAYPVAAVNAFIIVINLYYLYQMLATREFFRLLEVRPEDEYLHEFLAFYADDIRHSHPGFAPAPEPTQVAFFVLRNMVPAGLLIGELHDGDQLYVRLDYAIPGYRDLKIGRFLYQEHAADFRARGIRQICTAPGAPVHQRYLRQMGFQPSGPDLYCLELA